MKKTLIALTLFSLVFSVANAQKKYEKIIYHDVSADAEDMVVMAKDIVSTKEQTKFVLKINNKSDHILLFRPEESALKLNGKDLKPAEKWLIVHPTENDYRTVNFKGPDFMVNQYAYNVEGVYKISEKERPVEAPEFLLPPSVNEFKAGNFTCNMTSLSKETDKTTVKFDCRYTGDKIGIINPGRAAIKLPDGSEIANAKSGSQSEVLSKGDSKKITLAWKRMEGGKATDMQLIKMQILWRNTFVEADPVKLKSVLLDMKINEVASK